jgi:hypothetical protein
MERPILASEQVYGGLNLDWEEEEQQQQYISMTFAKLNIFSILGIYFYLFHRSWIINVNSQLHL